MVKRSRFLEEVTESRLGTGNEHPDTGTSCQTKEQEEHTECHQSRRKGTWASMWTNEHQ